MWCMHILLQSLTIKRLLVNMHSEITYISLLIIPCIIYHVTNKETLNLDNKKI